MDTEKAGLAAGEYLPDFELRSSDNERHRPSDYRNRCNLVVVFAGGRANDFSRNLLRGLTALQAPLSAGDADVLAVVGGTPQEVDDLAATEGLNFPVLADVDGTAHRAFGATEMSGRGLAPAVYVTGRYGRIYLAARTGDGETLPVAQDILRWVRFIEAECPECGQVQIFQ